MTTNLDTLDQSGVDSAGLLEGARNLLVNCAEARPGERLLIIEEKPALGWYDAAAPAALAAEAEAMGLQVDRLTVGAPGNDRGADLFPTIARHDCTIFMARIGDQDRFGQPPPGTRTVMSYARDAGMLASAYGRVDHRALVALKTAVNEIALAAERIEIRCPLGTAIEGPVSDAFRETAADVTVRRFPLGVPQPVDASTLSGRVALSGYLTTTGSHVYEPASVTLPGVVFAEVRDGRIAGFEGDAESAARVREHYRHVSGLFGIDPDVVHSWHAGIHPGCRYDRPAAEDPDRWSNNIFTHPRFLHFHTCGAYAPGEISWLLIDQSVLMDGRPLWDRGRLRPDLFPAAARCLEDWPALAAVFAHPSEALGLG